MATETEQNVNIDLRTTIENLHPIESGHALLGTVTIFGTSHHAQFIRVKDEGDLIEPADDAPEVVQLWFADLEQVYEGAHHTVNVPGFPGRYVLCIFPYTE